MKVNKYLVIGMLAMSTFTAYSHNEKDKSKSANVDSEPISTVQTNNFERKSVGYNSVINSESKAAQTENRIGDIGIVNNSWMKRKGSIGYNSVLTLFPKQDLIFGFNSCVNDKGDVIRFKELSDRRVLTNEWSKRKGSIGYHSLIKNTGDPKGCR